MGVGHVSPRPFSPARPGPDLPRRQHRRVGEVGARALTRARRQLGGLGEHIACWYLRDQGLSVLARNLEVPGGEIDIVARDGDVVVIVEVRTTKGQQDPIDAADEVKRAHVRRLGTRVGAARVDLMGVGLSERGLDLHWLPGKA